MAMSPERLIHRGFHIEAQPHMTPRAGEDWIHNQETPTIWINRDYCKKCDICIAVCPEDVYRAGEDGIPIAIQPDQCIWCEKCEIYCPDFAIVLQGHKGW